MALYTVYGLIVRFTRYCITAAKSDSIKLPPQQAVVDCCYCRVDSVYWIIKGPCHTNIGPFLISSNNYKLVVGKKVKTVSIASLISRKFKRKNE